MKLYLNFNLLSHDEWPCLNLGLIGFIKTNVPIFGWFKFIEFWIFINRLITGSYSCPPAKYEY